MHPPSLPHFLLAFLLSVASLSAATPPPAPAALDWAFRFATALETDRTDQARAQAEVVADYLAVGEFTTATKAADQILTWRRVAAWADTATALARRGDTNAAAALQQTEQLLPGVRGDWQRPRVIAHHGVALAAAGQLDRARALLPELPAEEAIKVRLALVRRLVADGRHAEAQSELDPLKDTKNFVVDGAWVEGWLLAAGTGITNSLPLLHTARDLLVKLPIGRQAELADEFAVALHRAGDTAGASNLLVATAQLLEPAEAEFRAPGLVRFARAWSQIGQPALATEWRQQAAALARTGDPMSQPATCAFVAGLLIEAGQTEAAWQLYNHGLSVAAGFVNARPRALALVALCRSIGRHQQPLPAEWSTRLAKLYAGLGDPW